MPGSFFRRRVRVGFLMPVWCVGGTERWHLSLLPGLDPGLVDVVGVSVVSSDLVARHVVDLAGMCPVAFGREWAVRLAGSVDVLVVWGMGDLGGFLGIEPGSPRPRIVYVLHGDGKLAFTRGTAESSVSMIDVFVAVARVALDTVPKGREECATIIPNGVDPSAGVPPPGETRESIRGRLGIPRDAYVVGSIGRLSIPDKRVDLTVAAMGHLPSDCWLLVAGDGPDGMQVRGACTAPDRTVFVGPVSRPGDVLPALDCLVFPSWSEGFGFAPCEAILGGVPVIGTSVGIFAEHPYLVAPLPDDPLPVDLAGAILRDRRDVAAREKRVDLAARFVATTFDLGSFRRAWSDFLGAGAVLPGPCCGKSSHSSGTASLR